MKFSLPHSTVARLTSALFLAVAIILVAMQLSFRLSRSRLKQYARYQVQQHSAFLQELSDELFLSDYWVFNSFMTGLADIDCDFHSTADTLRISYSFSPQALADLSTDVIFKRLRSFIGYNEDDYAATMIFEPGVIKDAPDGLAAMVKSSHPDVRYNLLDLYDVFDSDLYRRVKTYDKPLKSSGYTTGDSLWVMTTAVPFSDERGRIIGELWIDWDHRQTSRELSLNHPGSDVCVAIIDDRGRIIASADSSENALPLKEVARHIFGDEGVGPWYDELQRRIATGEFTSFRTAAKDDVLVTFLSPTDGSEYMLLMVNSEKKIYSVEKKYTLLSNLIMLTGILLVSLCLIYIFITVRREHEKSLKLENELDMAAAIQQALLPANASDGSASPCEVYGFQRPAKSVGGDLYDFVRKGDRLHFCIGDVSGKGMPAALVMTQLCSLYRYLAERTSDPQEIVTQMNRAVMERSDDSMFCTLLVGVLDLRTGLLEWCNAGHNPPVFIPADGQHVRFLKIKPNLPLYAFADYAYQKESLSMKAGDRLFLYTDGVTEARNDGDGFYGEASTLASLQAHGCLPFDRLVGHLLDDLSAFTGPAEQNDDITMLCVSWNGASQAKL